MKASDAIASAIERQGAATPEIVRHGAQAATGTDAVTGNVPGGAAAQVPGAAVRRFLATARAA